MSKNTFNRDNLDTYLRELAKEFRRINGKKMPAEIILVGGASILINYGFRDMTNDMDAIIQASSSMKEAINRVGDRMNLPNGWINDDFVKTKSYSHNLILHSKYYRTYSNIVSIRTVSSEYLIAMKLMSLRNYKADMSDIIGIINEEKNNGRNISLNDVKKATIELYGDYNALPELSRKFIDDVFNAKNLLSMYESVRFEETTNKEVLLEFEKDYPDVLNEDNLCDILKNLKSKM